MDDLDLHNLDSLSFYIDEEKLRKMQEGGGEVVEDSGDDCESGACKI